MTNALADDLYSTLNDMTALRGELLLDDRLKMAIGQRSKWAQNLGVPYLVVVGKTVSNKGLIL